jgi:lysophospholipid acyltransferase (LPLAT)-like uncharacterized protein
MLKKKHFSQLKFFVKKVTKKTKVQNFIASLTFCYLYFCYKTSRFFYIGDSIIENEIQSNSPFIFCFWHARLALMPFSWKWNKQFYMMVSKHGDGQLIGKILKKCGPFDLISGSTNKDGGFVLKKAIELLKNGFVIGITPDGPRGPREEVSKGTAMLSYLSKRKMIPISCGIKNKKILKSWDKFQFPLPFSKVMFVVGDAIDAPQNKEDIEGARRDLEQALIQVSQQCDRDVQ